MLTNYRSMILNMNTIKIIYAMLLLVLFYLYTLILYQLICIFTFTAEINIQITTSSMFGNRIIF